jgi:hypothetical protein
MSEHGFHVHAHHEHVIEHEAQNEGQNEAHHGGRLTQYVAIFTAILSTLGAIISYQGGATQNEAMLYKNEAVLKKAQASDQWNYYQAKAQKGHMMELAMDLAPPSKKAYYQAQVEKYNAEKKKIQADAEALEEASRKANEKSEELLHPHHKQALAMTLTQIAISLASITALTRRRWLFGAAAVAAAGGGVLWVSSMMA